MSRDRKIKGKPARDRGLDPTTWRDVDEALKAGAVDGVPEGVDLEEFLWQTIPESRKEIEGRNPGRTFTPAAWAADAKGR